MGVVKDGSRSVVRTLASIPRRLGGTREEPLRTSAWEATLRDGPSCTPINPKNIHAMA